MKSLIPYRDCAGTFLRSPGFRKSHISSSRCKEVIVALKGIVSAGGQGLRVLQHLFTFFCIPFAKYVILQSELNLIQNISFSCEILGHCRQTILKLVYFELSTSERK